MARELAKLAKADLLNTNVEKFEVSPQVGAHAGSVEDGALGFRVPQKSAMIHHTRVIRGMSTN